MVTLAGPAPISQLACSERPGSCSFQANPPTLCGSAPYLACQLEAAVVLLSVGDEWDFSSIPPANQAQGHKRRFKQPHSISNFSGF